VGALVKKLRLFDDEVYAGKLDFVPPAAGTRMRLDINTLTALDVFDVHGARTPMSTVRL
jgi:hypothetical protein